MPDQMTTAAELAKNISPFRSDMPLDKQIEQACLAYMKEGAKRAAAVCDRHENNMASQSADDMSYWLCAEQSRQDKMAIINAADKWTEKDL
jgi:hypothetical protein